MPEAAPITVVIPAYNVEASVREAIENVRAQSVPVSEIILIDDGSRDQTARIAEELGARALVQPGGGVPAVRNAGIRAARQPWIAFLDPNDLWEPDKIEYQWAAVRRYPAVGIVSCGLYVVDAEVSLPSGRAAATGLSADISYFRRPEAGFLIDQMNYYASAALIQKDALFSVGPFDEALRSNADFECFLRIVARWPLAMVEQPLVCHCENVRSSFQHMEMASSSQEASDWVSERLEVVERMRADPDRYPRGVAQAYERSAMRALRAIGRSLLDQGRGGEARPLFARCLTGRFQFRAFLLWVLTWLRPAALERLVTLKRRSLLLLRRLGLVAPRAPQPESDSDERRLAVDVWTPQELVVSMLQVAGVKRDDMVYDLGCGDGRILVTAAQKFGARATGVELDSNFVQDTRERIHRLKLEDQVKIIHGNLLDVDLSPADVVTLYLRTDSNALLRPNLEKYLRPGSRVVSRDFHMIGWTPTRVEKVICGSRTHKIYLYEVGLKRPRP